MIEKIVILIEIHLRIEFNSELMENFVVESEEYMKYRK